VNIFAAMTSSHPQRLEHTYPTTPDVVWELWTTAAGIEAWWSPDGFTTEVRELDLRPGGALVHAMTATAPEQVAFMTEAGMPLTNVARKTFVDVEPTTRLSYTSLVDFVPGHEPYEHLTTVELTPVDGGVHVTMTVEPMHDDVWTERMLAGRANELENLAAVVART
jgi:uncharacterized protein YndB with AHSA1/START domain